MKFTALLATLLVAFCFAPAVRAAEPQKRELWLYYPVNLLVPENVDKLEPIWERAAKAGYTHVLVTDSKSSRLGALADGLPKYLKNVERTKAIAKRLNLKLVPALYSVGYSNDVLSNDPNLAEGIPAKDTPFVVGKDGVARVVSDAPPAFGKPSFVDEAVKVAGNEATITAHKTNTRMAFKVKTQPWRCYRISVTAKTENYTAYPEIKVIGAGERARQLQYEFPRVQHNQGWSTHHVVFNSRDNALVNIYFGVWGKADGTLHWKDWKIEEVGLLNVLRRPGCPLTVKGEDGKVYEEGKDYEPIVDPKMGRDPYAGEYKSNHEPPVIKTKLPEGTKLRVTWYHAAIIYEGQVSMCIAEPKADELLADQAKRMKAAWGDAAAGWMMQHDEFRTLGWCEACAATHKTPGQQLADNARKCTDWLKGDVTYVWSDMFDPLHNAIEGDYYLVNGPWAGAWEGLSKDTIIMNWNHGKRAESAKFFKDRGHKQIVATYYDQYTTMQQTKDWVETAKGDDSIIGFMYSTWRQDYKMIEAFAEIVKAK